MPTLSHVLLLLISVVELHQHCSPVLTIIVYKICKCHAVVSVLSAIILYVISIGSVVSEFPKLGEA